MANSKGTSKVASIKPVGFEFPRAIRAALFELKFRVYEARALAELTRDHVRDMPTQRLDIDVVDNCLSGIVRLLNNIDGLDDVKHLMQLANDEGLVIDDDPNNG